jgi:acetyl esterase
MRRVAIAVAVAAVAAGSAAPAVADPDAAPRQLVDVEVRRDLTYRTVDGRDLKLDAYVPAGGGLRPGVMAIYGGGWVLGSKALSGPIAHTLASQGFVTFAMDYRLAPRDPFPAAVEDVQASVAWVRAHASDFGLDPARLGALGGSAGGHLAALIGTLGDGPRNTGDRIAAAVSWAGPMDLHPDRFGPDSQIYLRAFLGCAGGSCDDATAAAASPISHIDPSDAHLLIANGQEDLLVPPDQAVRMAGALERAGVAHELLLVPNAGHDPRVVPPVVQPSFEFLRRELGDVEGASPGGGFGGVGDEGGGGLGGDGAGDDGRSWLAPTIVIAAAALAGGAIAVTVRRRRRVRYDDA